MLTSSATTAWRALCRRQRTRLLGRRAFLLDFGLILGLLHFEIALGERDVGLSVELDLLAFLHCEARLDLRIARRFGLADLAVSFHFGGALLSECVEVALFVADLLNGQHVDADAHAFGDRRQPRSSAF